MKKSKFKYDTRIREAELKFFDDLVGKYISIFRVDNTFISPPPNFQVSNQGKCSISFYSNEHGQHSTIELTSIFQETPPVADSGGIAFKKIYESKISLKTRMNLGLRQEWKPVTMISYPEKSSIKSFKFFGSKERRDIREIDPDLDLEYLGKLGFKDYPELEVDTIEFMVIEHENNKKTVISTCNGGFRYNFLTDSPIDSKMLNDSYVKVNGYEKNIVLHHMV